MNLTLTLTTKHTVGGAFDFSIDFHTRIKPLTSPPTPFSPATSASLIRTNPSRSNNHAVHTKNLLTISNYRATMLCDSQALSLSDDLVVSAPALCPKRLFVIFFRSLAPPLCLPSSCQLLAVGCQLFLPPSTLNFRLGTALSSQPSFVFILLRTLLHRQNVYP